MVLEAVLELELLLPPEVAISATTIPIARTLAMAMIVLALVLMGRAYALRLSANRSCPFATACL